MKKLIAGNWKMNGNRASAEALVQAVEHGIAEDHGLLGVCDFVVCPPFVHLSTAQEPLSHMKLGAQDCSEKPEGAVTGDISAQMLKDMGVSYVILGHSERRQYHAESDSLIVQKAQTAHKQGLVSIICVGELESEREAGLERDVVGRQMEGAIPSGATAENTVIAYEPVWAIGTGKTASVADIEAMHGFIRQKLTEMLAQGKNIRILYGGSVKPANAKEIFSVAHVNGALIGGASLKAEDFLGIARAAKI